MPSEKGKGARRAASGETAGGPPISPHPVSAWRPVWFKLVGGACAMLGLAIIGVAAAGPTRMSPSAGAVQAHLGGEWLAGPQAMTSGGHRTLGQVTSTPSSLGSPASTVPAPAGSSTARPPSPGPGSSPPAPSGVTAQGLVILNTADASELQKLPGVGHKRAERIVALRERLGRFRRVSDLLRVKGIGVKTLRRMKPHLVLNAP